LVSVAEPAADRPVELLTGWSRTAPTAARLVPLGTEADADALLAQSGPRGVLARGLGRSYGDAAQNAGGTVIDGTSLAQIHAVDVEHGIVRCDPGVSLDDLIRAMLPFGWFVHVTPGTRQVTVAGALAADVHGKSHHFDGSFANHVESFTLHSPTGTVEVTPESDPELFWGTAGSMGLTGVIGQVTLRMLPVHTSMIRAENVRFPDLDAVMTAMTQDDAGVRYSAAWIDCLAQGASLGRSILSRGDHAEVDDLPTKLRRDPLRFPPPGKLSAPPWAPNGLLNRLSIAAFNELWFRVSPALHGAHGVETISSFFHPLDGVHAWNRLYGSRGFLQYQYVVPDREHEAVRRSIEMLSEARAASFLAVLKRFGPGNPGPLSFPQPGWTLALDIPATVPGLDALLDRLDELVAEAGGRIYLAKDSRLRPELVPVMYPQLDRFAALRARVDPECVLQSDLQRRLSLP
jgi:decaprenylphospho-beta-D-ribofuranose 2-oxidase